MKHSHLNLEARCKTTAMGIMPHTDAGKALELALGLDIPFWPQLPNLSFYADMYAQASENFPRVVVDPDGEKVSFSTNRFEEELSDYSQRIAEPETFVLSQDYSAVYHRFLAEDLQDYPAIRGQITGPVSFGFRVTDENSRARSSTARESRLYSLISFKGKPTSSTGNSKGRAGMPLSGWMSPGWGGSSVAYLVITMSRLGKTIGASWLALTDTGRCTSVPMLTYHTF